MYKLQGRALSPVPQSSFLLASSWKSLGIIHSYEMSAFLRAAVHTHARQLRWSAGAPDTRTQGLSVEA